MVRDYNIENPYQENRSKEPKPNKDEGLEKFIVQRIKYLKETRRKIKIHRGVINDPAEEQRKILRHTILGLQYLLFKWREIK